MNFDSKHLNMLTSNQNFNRAVSLFDVIEIGKLDRKLFSERHFKIYEEIIDRLIKTIIQISEKTTFRASKDLRVNYLADMLQDKLLRLYELSKQLEDTSSKIFKKELTIREKKSYSLCQEI